MPPPGCKYITHSSTQDFHDTPIPAGFFDFNGRACDPFGDVINYVGQPIESSDRGAADTIVNRHGTPMNRSDPIGAEKTVAIEVAALRLASTEPITVLCDGEPTAWNVSMDLAETTAPKGTLTARKDHANGGTAEVTLFVYPRLTFVYVDNPSVVRVFDIAREGLHPVQLDTTFPWSHVLDPNEGFLQTDFLAGVDSSRVPQDEPALGVSDLPRMKRADAKCIQHTSPSGNYVHEICAIDNNGGQPMLHD